jgi:hypothetical protein
MDGRWGQSEGETVAQWTTGLWATIVTVLRCRLIENAQTSYHREYEFSQPFGSAKMFQFFLGR